MDQRSRQFAIVTGASTGIGYDLARECAEHGFDLLIAADEPQIEEAAQHLRARGATVDAVQADLRNEAGVEKLYETARGRKVDALLANAGRGLGRAFLDQDPIDWIACRSICRHTAMLMAPGSPWSRCPKSYAGR
jgi:uncharacterized protein